MTSLKKTSLLVVKLLLVILLILSTPVECLRCYHCKSVNLSNKMCEKISEKTPIKDTCYYTLPNGTKVTATTCVALRTISYTSKNTHVLLRSCIVDDAKDCSTVYFKGEAFQGCPDKCNSDLCNGKEPDEMRRSIEYKFKKQLIKQPLTIGPLKGKFVPNSPVLSSPDQYYQRNQQRPQQGYPQLNLNSANQFSRGIGGQDEYANQARFGRFDHTPVPQDSFDSNGQSNYGQNNQWRGSQQQFGPGQNNLPNYSGNNNYPNSNYHGNGRGNFYNNNNYNDTPIYPYHQGRSGTGDRGILESISCFFSILEMLIVLMERINVP